MKRRGIIILLALIMACSCGPKTPETPTSDGIQSGDKETTLLIYMTGSDLEAGSAAATKDLAEMAESGVDLCTSNVIVFTGGSPKWHSDVPVDVNAVLELTEDGFKQVESFEPMSMGTPENLSRFLNYACQNYPAKTYDLILWDHGNGPLIGYCVDKQYGDDTLTLTEMREALENSPFSSENKLGFVGFDACLMASAELICTLGPFADYLIASQETEPNFGWDYAFLEELGKTPSKELACAAADRYLEYCEAYYEKNPLFHSDVTMSVVDLRYADELQTDVNALFRKATPDVSGRFISFAVSRVNTRGFGRASTGSEYDLVDLRCLSEEMSASYPEETHQITDLLDRLVVYTVSNTEQSSGVSLYYPFFNKHYYSTSWKKEYREMNVFPDYLNFLNRYEQMWSGSDLQETFDTVLNVVPGTEAGTYFLPLSEEQLAVTAYARCFIMRRTGESVYTPIYAAATAQRTDGGMLVEFDGNVICVETPFGARGIVTAILKDRVGTKSYYQVPAALHMSDELQTCDIQLSADASDHSVEVKGIYPSDSGGDMLSTGKREEADLSEWKYMEFWEAGRRYLTRSDNGRILSYWDWPDNGVHAAFSVTLADGMQFRYVPLYEDGYQYSLMVELVDVQGNATWSEPYPLPLAPASSKPETEQMVVEPNAAGTAEWTVGGVRFELLAFCGMRNEPVYVIRATNENEAAISYRFENTTVGTVCFNKGATDDLEPGETKYIGFFGLNKAVQRSGLTGPVRFSVLVKERESGRTLCGNLQIVINDMQALDAGRISLPVFDAHAREQVIYSADGIEVRLLELGFIPTAQNGNPDSRYSTLTAYYLIENNTDEAHQVAIRSFSVNEAECDCTEGGGFVSVGAHNTYYLKTTLYRNGAFILDDAFSDTDGSKSKIGTLSASVVIDDRCLWCPIVLDEHADVAPYEPRGVLLYEDEIFRILEEFPEEGDDPAVVSLWIENRTDDLVEFTLYTGEDPFVAISSGEGVAVYGSVGPNIGKRMLLNLPEALRGQASFDINIRIIAGGTYQTIGSCKVFSAEEVQSR
jgi:hypothetical protein